MGSDDLYHQRKARHAEQLVRQEAKRKPFDKVLIVCEGSKTEPNYFRELADFHRIATANIEIDGSSGSSPRSVLDKALELYDIEKSTGDSFDRVFCVIDKDEHPLFEETIERARHVSCAEKLQIIQSVPCFEYWLLLHFTPTTKPFERTGKRSPAENVLHELREYFPEYSKGDSGTFSKLNDKIDTAKRYALQANRAARTSGTDNPTTKIVELVEYLESLVR